MIRVGIVGASGYTGLELLKILLRHPGVQIVALTSRDESNPPLHDVHPGLREQLNLNFTQLEVEQFCDQVDCAFSCLPHAASAEIVSQLLDRDVRVIDFSADYRLDQVELFEHWYQVPHPDPARVGKVPYGIPELYRESIGPANLVANPGCFPSSVLIPLAPLLKGQLIEASPIVVDSKTGISGAGRKAKLKFHFPECNESVAAYSIGAHRHMPEIENVLGRFTGNRPDVLFTPHLIPMTRGILSTIYVRPTRGTDVALIQNTLADYYGDEPFVRVSEVAPTTGQVHLTNFCDVHVGQGKDWIVIVTALDNLIKGASGAAVQNFNVMFDFPETTALV